MHQNDQTIVVRHREFLMEVKSSANFVVQANFPINPGMAETFPWLSRIANNYQQYRVRGMVYHYVPTSGSAVASTNNALGSVMLQTSYRSTDSQPKNKIELLNEYWATETVPSETMCHPIECNPNENPFNVQYIRGFNVPVGENQLMYDLGQTYVATSGQQADNVTLGDLWVTYEIELKKPVIASNVTMGDTYREAVGSWPPSASTFYYPDTTFGDIGLRVVGMTLTIPSGAHGLFYIYANASVTSGSWTGSSTFSNCSVQFIDGVRNRYETPGAPTGQISYALAVVKDDYDTIATVTFPLPTVVAITRIALVVVNKH
jgi:hypothetical protein